MKKENAALSVTEVNAISEKEFIESHPIDPNSEIGKFNALTKAQLDNLRNPNAEDFSRAHDTIMNCVTNSKEWAGLRNKKDKQIKNNN